MWFPLWLVIHSLLLAAQGPRSQRHLQTSPAPPALQNFPGSCLLPRTGKGGWPTLSALSCSAGAQGIVNSGLIPSLVWKLQREEEEIQGLLLDTLAACLMEDATEALGSHVVPFLKQKLLSTNDDIRSKAARTLIAVR